MMMINPIIFTRTRRRCCCIIWKLMGPMRCIARTDSTQLLLLSVHLTGSCYCQAVADGQAGN
jgi:hypothetical protein